MAATALCNIPAKKGPASGDPTSTGGLPLALHFEVDETVPDGVRRILSEALEAIASDLRDDSLDDERAVHETRRNCKRIRAVLRMVRDELGDGWSSEDRWYRDLARSLSSARDAVAMMATLERVSQRYHKQVKKRTFEALREVLEARGVREAEGVAALRERAAEDIEGAMARTAELPLQATGFAALAPGLGATYGRARLILLQAAEEGRAEDFHHLRKRVKNLYYQVGTLRKSEPKRIEAMESRFDRLAEILGDAQDLDVLRKALGEATEGREAEVVKALAGAWERELHREVLLLGAEALSRPDPEFVAELEEYWTAWRGRGAPSK